MFVDAVDLLLERRGDGVRDLFGRRARIERGHRDGGRRDLRILVDRQREVGDQPGQRDDHRHGGRENRPVDEEVREAHCLRLRGRCRCSASPGSDSVLFSPRETPVGNAADDAFLHRDPAAGPRALHAADDDAVLRREPFRDHAQAVDQPARAHDLLAHDALGVDDVHDLARLVGDDGLVRHEQRVERLQSRTAAAGRTCRAR